MIIIFKYTIDSIDGEVYIILFCITNVLIFLMNLMTFFFF